jgi:hypothetical protein
MYRFLVRSIFSLCVLTFTQTSSFAFAGGGYSQLFPNTKNAKNELWVLWTSLGREGRGEECAYKTQLRLYDQNFIMIDSLDISEGERMVEIGEKVMPLTQFESLADSLYRAAILSLKSKYSGLIFLTFNGAKVAVSDTLGYLQIIRNQVIETYQDTSKYKGTETISLMHDTFQNINALQYKGKQYPIDKWSTILSDNGDFLGWPWRRIAVHGAKFYAVGDEEYIVLHFEVMFSYSELDMQYSEISQSTDTWNAQMYHPIGWHHNGQEVMFRL